MLARGSVGAGVLSCLESVRQVFPVNNRGDRTRCESEL